MVITIHINISSFKYLFLHVEWHYLDWEYDLPVGMCKCDDRRTKPVYSYHFVCSWPIPKPWTEIRTPLYASETATCTMEIYHLWYRMVAKAFNNHEIDEVTIEHNSSEEENEQLQPEAAGANRVLF